MASNFDLSPEESNELVTSGICCTMQCRNVKFHHNPRLNDIECILRFK